jgi:hypothetical protein
VALSALSTAAHAQSSITGIVRDTSGGVLPGVTVEAASPALIEKTRSAVTDGEGVYRIIDLRPGLYTVTFTLTGFSSVRREAIDLPASFTATVSVEMTVGSLEETITVSGQFSTTFCSGRIGRSPSRSRFEPLNRRATRATRRRARCADYCHHRR